MCIVETGPLAWITGRFLAFTSSSRTHCQCQNAVKGLTIPGWGHPISPVSYKRTIYRVYLGVYIFWVIWTYKGLLKFYFGSLFWVKGQITKNFDIIFARCLILRSFYNYWGHQGQINSPILETFDFYLL